jgi:hypothetical protein
VWIEGLSIMISRPITSAEHQKCWRTRMRMALFAAGLFASLALAVSPFLHPATARAFDDKYYDWCTNSLGQTKAVCCTNAGGEMFSGNCFDPAVLHPPVTAVPTITQQILPPPVIAPAP